MQLHFGADRKRVVTFSEFSQVLHDFHEEHAVQAFLRFDKNKVSGYFELPCICRNVIKSF